MELRRKASRLQDEPESDFSVGQKVWVVEGFLGTITAIESGHVDNEQYLIELDDGMGGGTWGSGEIQPAEEVVARRVEAKVASEDYPELLDILEERLPMPHSEPLGDVTGVTDVTGGIVREASYVVLDDADQVVAGPFTSRLDAVDAEKMLREDGEMNLYIQREGSKETGWFMDKILEPMADRMIAAQPEHIRYNEQTGAMSSYDWCFSGDTEFLTSQGYRLFKEMVGETVEVLDGRGDWVEAPVREFGIQPLRKLTLKKGRAKKEIYVTGNHRWLTHTRKSFRGAKRDTVTTDGLAPGMKLAYQTPRSILHHLILDPVGVASGFVFGDGTLDRTTAKVNLWGEKDRQMIRYFDGYPQSVVRPGENQREGDGIRVGQLPRFMKERPSLDESPSYLYGWLAGYFAADGRVTKSGGATLDTANVDDADFVVAVCNRLGIAIHQVKERQKRSCAGRGRIHEYRVKQYGECGWCDSLHTTYVISFVASTLESRFFLIDAHRERFTEKSVTTIAEAQVQDLGLSWVVESVEETDRVETVYCVSVPTTESFVLQGTLLTGNCRFRVRRRCFFPKTLDPVQTQQRGYGVWEPIDRGFCWREKWDDQKACPAPSEPGPESKEPGAFAEIEVQWSGQAITYEQGMNRIPVKWASKSVPVEIRLSANHTQHTADLVEGEFVWHLTAAWRDIQEKATRIRRDGHVRIISSSPAYLVGEVRGDTNIYQTTLMREPGTNRVALWECFLPDAPVLMADGTEKPISQVRPGDLVLTHEGQIQRVVRAEPKPYSGEIARLKVNGDNREFIATAGHEVWSANEDFGLSGRSRDVLYRHTGSTNPPLDPHVGWNEVGSLGVGDYLSRTPVTEDLSLAVFGRKPDEALAGLVGWYIAEGYLIKGQRSRLGFSLHEDEMHVVEFLDEVCRDWFGVVGTVRHITEDHKLDYRVSSPDLYALLEDWVGTGAKTKRLAPSLLLLDRDFQKAMMTAWLAGDGHTEKRMVHVIDSASETLIRQAREVMARLGYVTNVRTVTEHNTGGLETTRNAGPLYRLAWSAWEPFGDQRQQITQFIKNETIWHRITEVVHEHYEGEVWDIEVEGDHSFRAYGMNVHNCGCAWAAYSWGRSGRWKRFEGRMCVPPETMISMADGTFKRIDEVSVGDLVVTHNGIGPVEQVIITEDYVGPLQVIHSAGYALSLSITGNHEVWGYGTPDRLRKSWQDTKGQGFKFYDESFLTDEQPSWIDADQMKVHDWLTGPVRSNTFSGAFDLAVHLIEQEVSHEVEDGRVYTTYLHGGHTSTRHRSDSMPEWIVPSEALMYVLGLYLAEGNFDSKRAEVQWSIHEDEVSTIGKKLQIALDELDAGILRTYTRPETRGVSLRLTNRPLAHLLHALAGEGSRTKALHPWVMMLSPEYQSQLLAAYWDGDGTQTDRRLRFDTASDQLAQQVYDLLVRCGHLPSWTQNEVNGGPTNRDQAFTQNHISYVPDPRYVNGRRANDGYYSAKISSVATENYDGSVYNLKVTGDESYVANGRIVHNCSHALALHYEGQSRGWGGQTIQEDQEMPQWRSDPSITVKVPGDYKKPEIGEWRLSSRDEDTSHTVDLDPSLHPAPVEAMVRDMAADGDSPQEIASLLASFGISNAKNVVASITKEASLRDVIVKVRGRVKRLLDIIGDKAVTDDGEEVDIREIEHPNWHPTRGLSGGSTASKIAAGNYEVDTPYGKATILRVDQRRNQGDKYPGTTWMITYPGETHPDDAVPTLAMAREWIQQWVEDKGTTASKTSAEMPSSEGVEEQLTGVAKWLARQFGVPAPNVFVSNQRGWLDELLQGFYDYMDQSIRLYDVRNQKGMVWVTLVHEFAHHLDYHRRGVVTDSEAEAHAPAFWSAYDEVSAKFQSIPGMAAAYGSEIARSKNYHIIYYENSRVSCLVGKTANADSKDGAMIALRPPDEILSQVHVEAGEDYDNLHVTVAYLGKADEVDQDAIELAVAEWASKWGPIPGQLSGYGVFENGDERVLYASVDSPGLDRARDDLLDLLAAHGLAPEDNHGFDPHMTLQYGDVEVPTSMPAEAKAEFTFPSVYVVYGPTWIEFPFGGGIEVEASSEAEPVDTSGIADFERQENQTDPFAGVALKEDDDGWYVSTHRARSDSYVSAEAIPDGDIEFIRSTGKTAVHISEVSPENLVVGGIVEMSGNEYRIVATDRQKIMFVLDRDPSKGIFTGFTNDDGTYMSQIRWDAPAWQYPEFIPKTGELKDEPEAALPETTAEEDESDIADFAGDETEVADDPDIGAPAAIVEEDPDRAGEEIEPGDPKLAWLMKGTSQSDDSDFDIAKAAKQHLGLKDFTPAEQHALINEGEDVQAANLDKLQLEGTHYELLDAVEEEEDDSMWLM